MKTDQKVTRPGYFSRLGLIIISGLICAGTSVYCQNIKGGNDQSNIIEAAQGKIALDSKPVSVLLAPTQLKIEDQQGLGARLKNLGAGKRIYLVVKDLSVASSPGVLYHIYLDLPADTKTDGNNEYFAGTINFFDAVDKNAPDIACGDARFFSFDITELVKNLAAKGKLLKQNTITIFPGGVPVADSNPVVGSLRLIEQ